MATKTEAQSVGGYIRDLRVSKEMTLQELADAISISLAVLGRIELGERSLNMELVPALAKALTVDYKKLKVDLMALKLKEDYGDEDFFQEATIKASKI